MKPFEIFSTGTHRDSKGKKLAVTDKMLADIAAHYRPELSEAPLVIGHPQTNDPAYGWANSFSVKGDKLIVHPDQVNADFSDGVKSGAYKKRSISLYGPNDPSNPVPGIYYPRHIGFLGAARPAISGLRAVEFSACDDLHEFTSDLSAELSGTADKQASGIAMILRGIKNLLIPDPDEFQAARSEFQAQKTIPKPKQEEIMKTKKDEKLDFAQREAALKKKEEAADARELEFNQSQIAVRAAEDAALIEGLEKDGKVPPSAKGGILDFMATLSDEDGASFEFSQGEDKVTKTPRAYFRDMIAGANTQINFSEVSAEDADEGEDAGDAQSIAERAIEFQAEKAAKGIEISIIAAVDHVTKGKNNA